MIKPPGLSRGETIGIISPSWGGAGLFPHRVQSAVRYLESLGFKTKTACHALNHSEFVSDIAEKRVADIHDMFTAPEIRAIITAIGGDHSCHSLEFEDYFGVPRLEAVRSS